MRSLSCNKLHLSYDKCHLSHDKWPPKTVANFSSPTNFQGTFRRSPAQKTLTTLHDKLSKGEAGVPQVTEVMVRQRKESTSGHKKKLKK